MMIWRMMTKMRKAQMPPRGNKSVEARTTCREETTSAHSATRLIFLTLPCIRIWRTSTPRDLMASLWLPSTPDGVEVGPRRMRLVVVLTLNPLAATSLRQLIRWVALSSPSKALTRFTPRYSSNEEPKSRKKRTARVKKESQGFKTSAVRTKSAKSLWRLIIWTLKTNLLFKMELLTNLNRCPHLFQFYSHQFSNRICRKREVASQRLTMNKKHGKNVKLKSGQTSRNDWKLMRLKTKRRCWCASTNSNLTHSSKRCWCTLKNCKTSLRRRRPNKLCRDWTSNKVAFKLHLLAISLRAPQTALLRCSKVAFEACLPICKRAKNLVVEIDMLLLFHRAVAKSSKLRRSWLTRPPLKTESIFLNMTSQLLRRIFKRRLNLASWKMQLRKK